MNQYFQIAYVDGDITLQQLYQLYKMKILTVEQIAYILNDIKKDGVRQKFYRMKKGEVLQMVLREWQKNRLIAVLEETNNKIAKVLNLNQRENNHDQHRNRSRSQSEPGI